MPSTRWHVAQVVEGPGIYRSHLGEPFRCADIHSCDCIPLDAQESLLLWATTGASVGQAFGLLWPCGSACNHSILCQQLGSCGILFQLTDLCPVCTCILIDWFKPRWGVPLCAQASALRLWVEDRSQQNGQANLRAQHMAAALAVANAAAVNGSFLGQHPSVMSGPLQESFRGWHGPPA